MAVHQTAIISPEAELADDVEIGPFVVMRGDVRIGEGTVVEERASIIGSTEIGCHNRICCGAVVGGDPQDLSYNKQKSYLKIGDRNVIREYCTIHRGATEGATTLIGNDNMFMALSHIAHDCRIHNRVVVANNSLIAGHVEIFDDAVVSGEVAVHQFTRIGRLGMAAGLSRVARDIPPFMIAMGESAVLGPNVVGMKRHDFSLQSRRAVRRAFKVLYRSGLPFSEAIGRLKENPGAPEVAELVDFVHDSQRGICVHRRLPYLFQHQDSNSMKRNG